MFCGYLGIISRFLGPAVVVFVSLSCGFCSGQTVAIWTGGGDGTSYSDPANWNIGVVPINGGGTNYNVIVPDGENISFDISGSISGISYGSGGSIEIVGGINFEINSVALLNSSISAEGAGSRFSANGIGVQLGNGCRLDATNGAIIETSANTYNYTGNANLTAFHASGAGSTIDSSSMNSISRTPTNEWAVGTYYIADNGGLLDFSGVNSIDGGGWNGFNQFEISSGGDIDFQNVTTIHNDNRFIIDVSSYELPSLESASGLVVDLAVGTDFSTDGLLTVGGGHSSSFMIRDQSTWNAANLTTLNDTNLMISVGGTLNAPQLRTFRNSSLSLEPGVSFNAGLLEDVDNSSFQVSGGTEFAIGATSYNYTGNANLTAFHASGAGSTIDSSSMNSLSRTPTNEWAVGTYYIADNSGLLDFSGVNSIDGGGWNGFNQFEISSGGDIDFQNVTTIHNDNRFIIDVSSYELPSLESASGLVVDLAVGTDFSTDGLLTVGGGHSSQFNIPIFATWNAANLTTLNDTNLMVSVGGTLNAPQLRTFRNSSLSLEPGVSFNAGLLEDVDNSSFQVSGGTEFAIGATSYNYTGNANLTAFHASGAGSTIDSSSMNSLSRTPTNEWAVGTYYVADNGGLLDFSGVNSIDGGGWNGFNQFEISSGGSMVFGELVMSRKNYVEINGSNSTLFANSLIADSDSIFEVNNLGKIELRGSLLHKHTSENRFNLDQGRIGFDNTTEAWLEIAGENLGSNTNGLNNFAFQQLTVGGNASTKLYLTDQYDNGNRNGGSEVQYLLDVNGEGLVLNSGGTVVLMGHDLFISNGTDSFFNARDLFNPGDEFVQYGNGFISLTGDRGEILNGSFETGDLKGFKTVGSGMAEVVETPGDPPFLQLTAGSPIDVTQNVSTLDEAFFFSFDAMTEADSGILSLLVNGDVLTTWDYTELTGSEFSRYSFLINDPNYLGLTDVELGLRWDANTGQSVSLDNWRMSAVPEPGSLLILSIAGLALSARRRRRV